MSGTNIDDEFLEMRIEAEKLIREALDSGTSTVSERYLSGYLSLMFMTEQEIRDLFDLIEREIKRTNKLLKDLQKEIKKLNVHFEQITSAQQNILHYTEQTHKNTIQILKVLQKRG